MNHWRGTLFVSVHVTLRKDVAPENRVIPHVKKHTIIIIIIIIIIITIIQSFTLFSSISYVSSSTALCYFCIYVMLSA
jgi:hypothetical protein